MNMEDNGKQIIEIKKKIQSKSNNYVQLCSEIHTIECVSNVFVPTGKPGKITKQYTAHRHTQKELDRE